MSWSFAATPPMKNSQESHGVFNDVYLKMGRKLEKYRKIIFFPEDVPMFPPRTPSPSIQGHRRHSAAILAGWCDGVTDLVLLKEILGHLGASGWTVILPTQKI